MVAKPVVVTRKQVIAAFPKRQRDSHKGQFGMVGIIGGNNGMVGAALLAGRAALKLGSGIVHVGLLADNAPSVDSLQPELMLHSAQGLLKILALSANASEKSASLSPTHERPMAIVAIGNGLGRGLAAQKILYDALKLQASLVLDADALNILAARPDLRAMLLERKISSVVTPHPGEAARLLGCSSAEVQASRLGAALEIAKRLRCSVVLKGADSIIVTRDGKTYINRTGNPGMSAAGMGDALSGIIAAFIAQGMSVDDALLLAVHLHGAAGDALAQQVATMGMSASEVTDWARWLLNQWL